MKKSLLAVSALSLAIMSGSASAAVANGQLTLNWQGVVPTAPVAATAWAFVDALDVPYVAGTEQLNISLDTTGNLTATGVKPYSFYIVPVTGTVTAGTPVTRDPTANVNDIFAYLGTEPVSGGFVGNKQLDLAAAVVPADGEVAITLNGAALKVGSADQIKVPHATAAGSATNISIDLSAKVAAADFTEGTSISFTAPVVFAVDI